MKKAYSLTLLFIAFIINVDAQCTPPTINPSGPTTFCAGGSVTLTASSGANYLWSTGPTTRSITVTATGSYSVTESGCTSAGTIIIVDNFSVTGSSTPVSCSGGHDGSAMATVQGGSSPYHFSWSNSQTSALITNLAAGTYFLLATDATGCNYSLSTSVTQPAAITITASGPTTFCSGSSVTLTASNGASYLWSTGASTQSITVTASGNYSVTENGCTSSATTVTVNSSVSVNAVGNQSVCNGASTAAVHFTGTAAGYMWSNSNSATGLAAGGFGDISAFTANNAGGIPVVDTITVTPVPSGLAYIPSGSFNDYISVINTATNTQIATFYAGSTVKGIAVSADGTRLYIGNDIGQIRVINTSNNAQITFVNVPGSVNCLSLSPDGSRLYVSGRNSTFQNGYISTINTATNTLVSTINAGTYAGAVSVSPDGNNIYALVNNGGNKIYIVSKSSNAVTDSIGFSTSFSFSSGILVSPDNTLYVSAAGSGLYVINPISKAIITTISGSYVGELALSPDGSKLYASSNGFINIINTATTTVAGNIKSIDGTAQGLCVSSDGSRIFEISSNGVFCTISAATNSIVSTSTSSAASFYPLTNNFASGSGCAGTPISFTITVNPKPEINGGISICSGSSTVLTVTPSSSYLWNTGATTQNITVVDSGTYSVTVANQGCGTTASHHVSSTTLPAVNSGNLINRTFCNGDVLNFSIPLVIGIGDSPLDGVIWSLDNPGIGLFKNGGAGDLPPFTAINTGAIPVIGTVTVTPVLKGYAYILDLGHQSVHVINTATGVLTTDISLPTGGFIGSLVVSPDGSKIYATANTKLFTINTSTNIVIGNLPLISLCQGISVNADGSLLYASIGSMIRVVNTLSNTIIADIQVPMGAYYAPAISPDGSTLYVSGDNKISVINASTLAVTSTISVPNGSGHIVLSPDGSQLYTCSSGHTTVINTASNTIVASILTDAPQDIAINADGSKVYVTSRFNKLYVINATSNSVAATIAVGNNPGPIAITPDGTRLYIENTGNGKLSVINASTNTLMEELSVGNFGSFGEVPLSHNFLSGSSCSGVPTSFTISVNPAPTITASGNTTFCSGGSVVLTSSASSSYSWSNGATTQSITATATGNYTVTTANLNNGCSNTATASVTVNTPPAVNSVSNQNLCNGTLSSPVQFTGTGDGYIWSNSNTAIGLSPCGTGNISAFSPVNNGTTSITATITATPVLTGYAYIVDVNNRSVSKVNTANNAVEATISIGGSYPNAVALNADGSRVYVTASDNTVTVINSLTNSVIATIPVGNGALAVAANNSRVYVANNEDGTVSIINAATNAVTATITVGNSPDGIALSQDGSKVFVANAGDNTISVINTVTNSVTATITVGSSPTTLTVSPDGARIYVINQADNSVSVINTVNNTVLSTVNLPYSTNGATITTLQSLSITPDGSKLYVTDGFNSIFVINTLTNVVSQIHLNYDNNFIVFGTGGISITPDGTRGYVTSISGSNGYVFEFNTLNDAITDSINTGYYQSVLGNFISGSTCMGVPTTFNITVNPASTITASGPTSFCTGGAVTLTASSSSSYVWSDGETTQSINASTTGVYNVTLADNCTSAGVAVYNNPTPTINTVTNQTVCADASIDPVILSDGLGLASTLYKWTNSNTTIGLGAYGEGVVPSFIATDTGSTAVNATITATAVTTFGNAYICDYNDNSVSVVDLSTNQVVATIPGIFAPVGVAISPDGSTVYVTSVSGGGVTAISTATNSITGSVSLNVTSQGAAVSPDGSKLYVTSFDDPYSPGFVYVIDTRTLSIITAVTVGTYPIGIAVTPDGKKVYVANFFSDATVSVIRTSDNTVISTVPTGSGPNSISVSSDGNRVYVVNISQNSITVINTANDQPIGSDIFINGSTGLNDGTISTDGKRFYVTDGVKPLVWVINTEADADTALTSIPLSNNPSCISTSADGNWLYVTNSYDNSVSVINTISNIVTANVPVGSYPQVLGNFVYSNSCSTTENYTISIKPDKITVTPSTVICSGNSTTLSITGGSSVSWSTGETTSSITVSTAGDYSVTSDDACILPPVHITVNSSPTINAVSNQPLCTGASTAPVHFSGSTIPGTTYQWSNSNTTIGLASNGTGDIASFTAVNSGTTPAIANVNVSAVAQTGFAYIPNGNDNTVSVIDITTGNVVSVVPVGSDPNGVALSPDETKAYITNVGDNSVSVINTSDNTVITTVAVGVQPYAIAVSPDGGRVYVMNTNEGSLSLINAYTNLVSATINIGVPANAISVSPDGSKLYAVYTFSNSVNVYNTSSFALIATISVGNAPIGIALSPDGSKLYIANEGDGTVSVVDASTYSVSAFIPTGNGPFSVATSPDGNRMYVTNAGDNTVSVINAIDNSVISTVGVGRGGFGISITPDGSQAYVPNYYDNTLSIINTSSNTVINTISIGNGPQAIGSFIFGSTCSSSPKNFTITVNPLPTASVSGGGCGSSSVNVALTGVAPWTLTYSINGVNQTPVTTSSNPYIISNPALGTYRVTALSDSNCTGTLFTGSAVVSAGTASVGGTVSPNAASACSGTNSGTLTLSGKTGNVLNWQLSTDGGAHYSTIANTTTSLSYSNLTAATLYRAVVQNGSCPSANSSPATITINAKPTAVVSGGGSACSGTILPDVKISFTGTAPWTFTYAINNVNQAPVTTSSNPYVITGAAAGTYTLKALNDANCTGTFTGSVTVTVLAASLGGAPAPDASVCAGSNSGVIYLYGSRGTVLKWQQSSDGGNHWVDITNVSSAQRYTNLTITTLYRAVVQYNTCPIAYSSAATITVNSVTRAGSISADMAVCAGSNNGALTVTGQTGSVLKWQQSTDGGFTYNDIDNSASTSLSFTNLSTTTLYTAVVQNGACSPFNAIPARVTVNAATVAGVAGPGDTVCSGSNSGIITLNGQTGTVLRWQYSTNGTDYMDITNIANAQTYRNLTATTLYRAVVQNSGCTPATSSPATITVNSETVAGSVDGAATVCYGNNSGTLTLSGYSGNIAKWQRSTDGGLSYTDIPNFTETLDYSNLTTTTMFLAVVQNGTCDPANSDPVTITVTPLAIGGTVSSSQVVCSGANGDTLRLSGQTGNVLKWQQSTDGGHTYQDISNTTTSQNYTNINVTTLYRAVVQSGSCDTAYSTPATITIVNSVSVAGAAGPDATVCSGFNSGTITLTGLIGSVLNWQQSTDGGHTYIDINIPNTTTTQTYTNLTVTTLFRAAVQSGVCTSAFSTPATITVNNLTVAGTVASDSIVCSGANGGLLTLSGQQGSVVKWQYSTNGGTGYNDIINTGTTQTYSNLTTTTLYRAVVQGGSCLAVGSSPATITMSSGIATASSNSPVCSGSTLTLFAGQGSSYSWTGPHGYISADQNPVKTGLTVNDTGIYNITYTVCGSLVSTSVDVSVATPPVLGTTVTNATCVGDDGAIDLSVSSGTSPFTYFWTNGSTTQSISNLTQGPYSATVTDAGGCTATTSTVVFLTLLQPAAPTYQSVYAGGYWNSACTWSHDSVPTNTDTARISTTGGASVVVNSPTTIGGLVVDTGAKVNTSGGNTLNITGNATLNGALQGNGNFSFNGSTPQIIFGNGGTVSNLVIANGVLLDPTNIVVTNSLTFNAANTLTSILTVDAGFQVIASPYTVPIYAGATTGWVNGTLQKTGLPVAGNTLMTFEVGDANKYAPVEMELNGLSGTSGSFSAATIAGAHSGIANSPIDPSKSVQRSWKISNSGTSFYNFDLTLNYNLSDISVGSNQSSFVIAQSEDGGSTWSLDNGSTSASSTTSTGLIYNSDFIVGQVICSKALPVLSTSVAATNACNGDNNGAIQVHTSGGYGPFTFLWSNGASGDSSLSGLKAGTYTVTVGTVGGCSTTATATVSQPASVILAQPAPKTICGSATVSLSVATSGTGLIYQWRKGTTNLPNGAKYIGVTSATLTINNANAADTASNYNCIIKLTSGCIETTANAAVTVGPAITAQPVLPAIIPCEGLPTSIKVTATGTGITYQWYKGSSPLVNGGSILGATTTTLGFNPLAVTDAGNYKVLITNTCGSTPSSVVNLQVNSKPVITSQPQSSQLTCLGDTISLTVSATGSGLTYQWKRGAVSLTDVVTASGSLVSGSTTPVLKIVNATTADAAVNYNCVVKGSCTSVTSASAIVVVGVPGVPGVITAPVGSTKICPHDQYSYSIRKVANATSYTWTVRGGSGAISHNGSGAADTLITVRYNSVIPVKDTISVTANDACGGSVASNLIITANRATQPLAITPAAGATIVCPGDQYAYSIRRVANATGYTWSLKDSSGTIGHNGSGTNDTLVNITYNTLINVRDSVMVTADNGCGSSMPAKLAITPNSPKLPGIITPQVGGTIVCPGDHYSYSIRKVTNATSYIWSLKASSGTISHPNGSGTSADTVITITYIKPTINVRDSLMVQAKNGCGSSAPAKLAITPNSPRTPGTITAQTGGIKVCPGDVYTYSIRKVIGATGYIWAVNGAAGSITHTNGSGISDTLVTITFTSVAASGNIISVSDSNSCGSSSPVSLAIGPNTIVPAPPAIAGKAYGLKSATQIYTVAPQAGITHYNWTWSTTGTPSPGSSAAVITGISKTTDSATVSFRDTFCTAVLSVTATNACGNTGVATILSLHGSPAAASIIIGSPTPCAGEHLAYSITPMLDAKSYQWTLPLGWSSVASTTSSISVTTGGTGGNIIVLGKNTCGNGANDTLRVTVGGAGCGREIGSMLAKAGEIAVYPNPTSGLTTCTFESSEESTGTIQLMDAVGRIIQNRTVTVATGVNNYELDMADYAKGIYIIVLHTRDSVFKGRIVVE